MCCAVSSSPAVCPLGLHGFDFPFSQSQQSSFCTSPWDCACLHVSHFLNLQVSMGSGTNVRSGGSNLPWPRSARLPESC